MQEHIERLRRHIADGTLIRNQWRGTDKHGRETACLLAAMVPQCGLDGSASSCPADVMPPWLARLVPDLDDRGSFAAWPTMVERFAGLAARWHTLDAAAWQRVQFAFLAAVVREAASHTQEPTVIACCERVAVLCDGVVDIGLIDPSSFDEARKAVVPAEAASRAASWAAWAAEEAWAAEAAAEAASWAAAAAAEAASWAAAAAAPRAAAWDRVTVSLFNAIEKELA